MLIQNRSFKKQEPSKDAKLYIIYCEGKKREVQYFNYFADISSNIRFEVVGSQHDGDTSPTGLFEKANSDINQEDAKYELVAGDEVWFVIDTDDWKGKIRNLRENCPKFSWNVVQSNPCFEVWLYYHCFEVMPSFEKLDSAQEWKNQLNGLIPGGFSSKKHPIKIIDAIENAKKYFTRNAAGGPNIACTEVYRLAESFFPLIEQIVRKTYHKELKCEK